MPNSVAQGWFHKNWLYHRDVINETSVFSLRVHSCHAGSDVVLSPDLTLSRRKEFGDHWMLPWLCWVSSLNLMTTFLWCSDVWLARVNVLPISLACSELRQLTHPQWYPDPLPRARLWSGEKTSSVVAVCGLGPSDYCQWAHSKFRVIVHGLCLHIIELKINCAWALSTHYRGKNQLCMGSVYTL